MARITQDRDIQAAFDAKFFVLRTPLTPFNQFLDWSDGIRSGALHRQGADAQEFEQAWADDVQMLRNRLRRILDRPEMVQALFVASPSLQSGIEHWKNAPNSKKGIQAERAIVRYFERMSTRSTPFGLFAGYSLGKADCQADIVSLDLPDQKEYRTCTRLDFDYLFALTSTLHRDPALVKELLYGPNSSLHRVSGAWHYVESRLVDGRRSYDLSKVTADEYLETALERARDGATFHELVEAVLTSGSEFPILRAEAEDYVQELVESQVLVSTLSPLLTGRPPLDDLIDQLSSLPSTTSVAGTLQSVRSELAALDAKGIGVARSSYEGIASTLRTLPAEFELERLFQVDMIKPAPGLVLGKNVFGEMLKGIDLLYRVGGTFEPGELHSFREAFSRRYEGALVPILEALDEEVGVGFGRFGSDSSPLLQGLAMGGRGTMPTSSGLTGWQALLLKRLVENGSALELCLDVTDFPASTENDYARLPDCFSFTTTVAAASCEAIQAGDFELYLIGGGGPPGARMFGRFCQSDPELEGCVQDLLRDEESNNRSAVFAEVAYLPEGRLGNVLCRPVLREYEIPYLARSGAPQKGQIALNDLLVGLSGGRITLFSKRLQCEVIPRLSNAHGFTNSALPPVYRFLCSLQHQFGVAVPVFTWGPLEHLDFLPRIRTGRLVLGLARWRLRKEEIELVAELSNSERFRAVQALRQKRKLPRWVVLHEADNALTADLDNPLSVDALVHVLKRRSEATLTEIYPPPELLCVTNPEGQFHHEINVPFVRRPKPDDANTKNANRAAISIFDSTAERAIRTVGPGQDWLFVKLYGGEAALDEILTTTVLPLAGRACASGWCRRWFFVRYADPRVHLRIRFNGPGQLLQRELLPQIADAFNPLLASGRLWKVQFDTYDREIERYGGPAAMTIAEDIFFADSLATLEVLASLEGDEALDSRWRIALLGADRMLSDFGFDLKAKRTALEGLCSAWNAEFQVTGPQKKQLAAKFRRERKNLEALLEYSSNSSSELNLAGPIFESRSSRIVPAVHSLHALKEAGLVRADFSGLVNSYLHMHINRLVRSSARLHELVLYDFLFNLYDAMMAREGRGGKHSAPARNQLRDEVRTAGDPEVWMPVMATGGGER